MSSKPNDIEMTTERIDHTAEARKYTEKALHPSTGSPEVGLVYAQLSNAEAMLALAEQQRIANLIALGAEGWSEDEAVNAILDLTPPEGDKGWINRGIRPDIAAALGIETGEER